ncbi:unnamed protein product [Clonostachys rosea]|uniref:Uncharacterized protein n=1 Tax=Bionectria ochroleuca TaxID=29856 RepID=A0ABY6UGX2_BIOOC|nr:unnamed protein product [Clonostachys rosea]
MSHIESSSRSSVANDVYWQDEENGNKVTSVSASNVSSSQLKLYLDQYYPERYSVQGHLSDYDNRRGLSSAATILDTARELYKSI